MSPGNDQNSSSNSMGRNGAIVKDIFVYFSVNFLYINRASFIHLIYDALNIFQDHKNERFITLFSFFSLVNSFDFIVCRMITILFLIISLSKKLSTDS